VGTAFKTLGWVLLVLILTGCITVPQGERADVILEDAHSSGSALAISPDSKILASGGKGGWIRLWRLDGGSEVAGWHAHRRAVNGIHFIRGGRRLISGGFNGKIAEWDLEGRLKREWQTPSPIISLVADSKANLVLTGHGDGQARLWRLSTSELLHAWQIFDGYIKTVAMDAGRGRFAASSHDGELAYWKIGVKPRYFDQSSYSSATLEFSPEGRYLYGAGWFSLYRWELASGALEDLKTEHFGRINRIAFMPDGQQLASISRQTDSSVLILDAATGKTVRRFQKHDLCGTVVTVSRDGRYLATTSDDASVRIWDLKSSNSTPAKEK
jgi:WD40 repeat protein